MEALPSTVYSLPEFGRFSELDNELKLYVFQYLNIQDLTSTSLTCKTWKLLSNSPSLWKQLALQICPTLDPKIEDFKNEFKNIKLTFTDLCDSDFECTCRHWNWEEQLGIDLSEGESKKITQAFSSFKKPKFICFDSAGQPKVEADPTERAALIYLTLMSKYFKGKTENMLFYTLDSQHPELSNRILFYQTYLNQLLEIQKKRSGDRNSQLFSCAIPSDLQISFLKYEKQRHQ